MAGSGTREGGQVALTVPHAWPPDAARGPFGLQTGAAQHRKEATEDIETKAEGACESWCCGSAGNALGNRVLHLPEAWSLSSSVRVG